MVAIAGEPARAGKALEVSARAYPPNHNQVTALRDDSCLANGLGPGDGLMGYGNAAGAALCAAL